MRLGRMRDDSEQALAASKDRLKKATAALEDAVKERRKQLEAAEKQVSQAHDEHRKRVKKAQEAVNEAGRSRKVGGGFLGPAKVYDDRVTINGKTYTLTPEVQATVDTAGNLSTTRRHTVTRFALLGPLSLFTPKKTKHDDRELFLLVEGPEWAEVVKCDVKQQAATRALAQSINVAARGVEQTLAERDERVSVAQSALNEVRIDTTEVERAERELQVAHAATDAIVARRDELLALVAGYHGGEAKETRKAQALADKVQELLAEPLELPVSVELAGPAEGEPGTIEPGEADVHAEVVDPSGEGEAEPDVIEQIRRLGELRDGGLITSDEFERKKAELLSRI